MKWKCLYSYVPQAKHNVWPEVIAAGGSLLSAGFSSTQASNLNATNRQWQESMHERYNTPAAMMRQYRRAGINPFLGQSDQIGSVFSGSPSQAMPDVPDLGQSVSQGMVAGAQVHQLNAEAGNYKAEEFNKVTQGLSQAVRDFGVDGARQYLSVTFPRLKNLGFDDYTINKVMDVTVASAAAQRDILDIDAKWQKKYGSEYRSDLMMRNQQEISEVVARIGLMSSESEKNRSQIEVNKQEITESFSRIARNFAEAFKLKKEGDYYVANTETANQIRNLIVDQFVLQNGLSGLSLLRGGLQYGIEEAGAYIKRKQASDPVLQGVKFGLETLGNVIHVGGNFSWSNMQGTIDSWSHSTAPAPTVVTGFTP